MDLFEPYHKINTLFKRDDRGIIIQDESVFPYYHKLIYWRFTEKLNGTNIRVIFDGNDVFFRGRNEKSIIPAPLLKNLKETFTVEKIGKVFNADIYKPVILYGEGVGKGINNGKGFNKDGNHFILFDILIDNIWLEYENVASIATSLDIPVTQVCLDHCSLDIAINLAKDGFESEFGDFEAEGLVGTPIGGLRDRCGNRIIIKLKTKDFKKAKAEREKNG